MEAEVGRSLPQDGMSGVERGENGQGGGERERNKKKERIHVWVSGTHIPAFLYLSHFGQFSSRLQDLLYLSVSWAYVKLPQRALRIKCDERGGSH